VPPHNIAKVDESQQGCVAVARGIGAFVFLTHQVGKGFPDAVIGYRGNLYLIEFKTGKGKLEEDQAEFAQKMDAVKSSSASAWNDVKAGANSAMDSVKQTYEKAKARFQ